MGKYLGCCEIYKDMILEMTKKWVIVITKRIRWVLHGKNVAYELTGPFDKVWAPQANNDSSNPPEHCYTSIFLAESFDLNIL